MSRPATPAGSGLAAGRGSESTRPEPVTGRG